MKNKIAIELIEEKIKQNQQAIRDYQYGKICLIGNANDNEQWYKKIIETTAELCESKKILEKLK